MPDKHIVFILSDQHHAGVAGFAGDPFVRTPNLDRLAAGGAAFDACYCPSPLCVPSRSSMLVSALPNVTKVYDNIASLRSDRATFVHCLDAAGYHTVLAGRMHFNGLDQRHGFAERLVGDITATVPGSLDQPYGVLANTTWHHPNSLKLSGAGHTSVLEYDRAVTDAAVACIARHERAEPLFLTVGLYKPHCPFVCPGELYRYYYDLLPPPDEQQLRAAIHPQLGRSQVFTRAGGFTAEDVRRARAAYYGLVELMDSQVARVVDSAEAKWGADNVMIVYASDHGETLGEHGLFWKENMYDASARVPMIFRLPGQIAAGRRLTEPTSLMDLGPTLLSFAGGPKLPGAQGVDLAAALTGRGKLDAGREVVSILGCSDRPMAMIRRGQWKLVRYQGSGADQLFDLAGDPLELRDLGGSLEHEAVRRDLSDRLAKWWDGDAVAREYAEFRPHRELIMAWGARHVRQGEHEQFVAGAECNRLDRP